MDWENIYRSLYNDQCEAADDDYMEYFAAEFSPDKIPVEDWEDDATSKEHLSNLLGELYEDRSDFAELMDTFGLDENVLAELGY